MKLLEINPNTHVQDNMVVLRQAETHLGRAGAGDPQKGLPRQKIWRTSQGMAGPAACQQQTRACRSPDARARQSQCESRRGEGGPGRTGPAAERSCPAAASRPTAATATVCMHAASVPAAGITTLCRLAFADMMAQAYTQAGTHVDLAHDTRQHDTNSSLCQFLSSCSQQTDSSYTHADCVVTLMTQAHCWR